MGSHPVRLLLAATLAAGTAGLRRELANAGGAAGARPEGAVARPSEFSPFRRTVLLLQGVRGSERRKYLQSLYDPLFMDVFTVHWGEMAEEDATDTFNFTVGVGAWRHNTTYLAGGVESDLLRLQRRGRAILRPTFVCKTRGSYQAWCLPDILKVAGLRNPTATGFLTVHADFWFRPSTIFAKTGMQHNAIWQLGGGMLATANETTGLHCLTGEAEIMQDRKWHWWDLEKTQLKAAHAAAMMQSTFGYDPTVCVGWSDAFYLPRSAWHLFANISAFVGSVFHEVAVPTVLQILHRHHGVPLQLERRCWGGCISAAQRADQIPMYPCGHRMDLSDQTTRDTVSSMLAEDLKALRRHTRPSEA